MRRPDFRLLRAAFREIWGPVGEDVRRGFRRRDAGLLAVPPLLSVLVYLLPATVQNGLILRYESPALHAYLSTHFVHAGMSALAWNLGGYLLVVTVLYALSLVARERTWFRRSFLVMVAPVPVAVAATTVLVGAAETGYGLMTVNAALAGVLPVAMFRMMDEKSRNSIGILNALSLVLLSVFMTTLRHAQTYRDVAILLTALGAAAYFSWRALRSIEDTARLGIRALREWHGYADLLLLAAVIYLGTTWLILFPAEVVQPLGVLGISAHYLAFVLGFVLSAALLVVHGHRDEGGYLLGDILPRR